MASAPAEMTSEPSLFGNFDAQRAAAEEQMEDIFEEVQPVQQAPAARVVDDLPPPAYQPRVAHFEPQDDEVEDTSGMFVAPKAPAPGTPSQEHMQRLRAAVERSHQTEPHAAPQASHLTEAEKPRFGINSLINRMTGHGHEAAPEAPVAQARATAAQPESAPDPDQERIEIPAFLRRQAN